jgi:serine/threonine-protein kinase
MTGLKVRDYEICERIGSGGVGDVFRATDLLLDRQVAIKLLRPGLGTQADIVERFRTEARTLAQLHHTNIAALYALQREGDTLAMIMELIDGKTLSTVLAEHGALSQAAAIAIALQALDGVGYAHQNGIVHRDLKPSNLMLGSEGQVKVMDFGIARCLGASRLTRAGHAVGTAQYMAPEQIRGQEADARADIYSLSMVLYEMLTDHLPFDGDSDYAILRAQVEEPPRSPCDFAPEIPRALEAVILRGLAKDPRERFASTLELAKALVDAAGGLGLATHEELRTLAIPRDRGGAGAMPATVDQVLLDPRGASRRPTSVLTSSDYLLWEPRDRGPSRASRGTLHLTDIVEEIPDAGGAGASAVKAPRGREAAPAKPRKVGGAPGARPRTEIWELAGEPGPDMPGAAPARARGWRRRVLTSRVAAGAAIAFVALTAGAPGPVRDRASAHGATPGHAATHASPRAGEPADTVAGALGQATVGSVPAGTRPALIAEDGTWELPPDAVEALRPAPAEAAAGTALEPPAAGGAAESGLLAEAAWALRGHSATRPTPAIPARKPRARVAQKPPTPPADVGKRPRKFAEPTGAGEAEGSDTTAGWTIRR